MSELFVWSTASLLAVGFGVGIVIGLTGMGGGALMTPALIFMGVPPSAAVANDLVAASINKTVGVSVHWRRGSPNVRLAGWLVVGSVPTAFAGAFIVKAAGTWVDPEQFLKVLIGCTLLIASATYAVRVYLQLSWRSLDGIEIPEPTVRPLPTVCVGAVGGLLVGITSVGSGSIMMVALLMLYPTLTALKLVGTDLLQSIPLVLAAAIGHVIVTGVDWSILIPLVVGGSPGTFLGAKIAHAVTPSIISRGIPIVLALTGLSMLEVPLVLWVSIAVGLILLGSIGGALTRRRRGRRPVSDHAAQGGRQ